MGARGRGPGLPPSAGRRSRRRGGATGRTPDWHLDAPVSGNWTHPSLTPGRREKAPICGRLVEPLLVEAPEDSPVLLMSFPGPDRKGALKFGGSNPRAPSGDLTVREDAALRLA